jgi:hypothetical protein
MQPYRERAAHLAAGSADYGVVHGFLIGRHLVGRERGKACHWSSSMVLTAHYAKRSLLLSNIFFGKE